MRTSGMGRSCWLFIALTWAGTAWASGGSYVVDDAAVTPAGHCQLESWLQAFGGGGRSLTAVPACSIGPVELSLGLVADTRTAHDPRYGGLKWLVRDGGDAGLSMALAANLSRVGGHTGDRGSYAAFTRPWARGSAWTFNVDLGVHRERGLPWRAQAGLGVEYQIAPRWSLLAEHLHDTGGERTSQAGLRWLFGPHSVDLVAGVDRHRSASRWLTLGLNLAF